MAALRKSLGMSKSKSKYSDLFYKKRDSKSSRSKNDSKLSAKDSSSQHKTGRKSSQKDLGAWNLDGRKKSGAVIDRKENYDINTDDSRKERSSYKPSDMYYRQSNLAYQQPKLNQSGNLSHLNQYSRERIERESLKGSRGRINEHLNGSM